MKEAIPRLNTSNYFFIRPDLLYMFYLYYKCNTNFHENRYKIEIWVKNDGAKYHFVFWDIECEETIGKSAATVYQSMVEVYIIVSTMIFTYSSIQIN